MYPSGCRDGSQGPLSVLEPTFLGDLPRSRPVTHGTEVQSPESVMPRLCLVGVPWTGSRIGCLRSLYYLPTKYDDSNPLSTGLVPRRFEWETERSEGRPVKLPLLESRTVHSGYECPDPHPDEGTSFRLVFVLVPPQTRESLVCVGRSLFSGQSIGRRNRKRDTEVKYRGTDYSR